MCMGWRNPAALSDWDAIIGRLDNQGAIEENVVFVNKISVLILMTC